MRKPLWQYPMKLSCRTAVQSGSSAICSFKIQLSKVPSWAFPLSRMLESGAYRQAGEIPPALGILVMSRVELRPPQKSSSYTLTSLETVCAQMMICPRLTDLLRTTSTTGSVFPFSQKTIWERISLWGLSVSPLREQEWVGTNATWYYLATSWVLAKRTWNADLLSSQLQEMMRGTWSLAQTIFSFTLSQPKISSLENSPKILRGLQGCLVKVAQQYLSNWSSWGSSTSIAFLFFWNWMMSPSLTSGLTENSMRSPQGRGNRAVTFWSMGR